MHGTSITASMKANKGPSERKSPRLPNGRFAFVVMQRAWGIFRTKAPAAVADIADKHISTAERWDRGERDMYVLDLLALVSDRQVGADMLRVFWDQVPDATRVVFLHQLKQEEEARQRAAKKKKLQAEIAAMDDVDRPQMKFATR